MTETKSNTGIIGAESYVTLHFVEDSIVDAKRFAKDNLDRAFQKELIAALSDGREYVVKVSPAETGKVALDREPSIRYHRQAIVALRNWKDAKLGEFVRPNTEPYGETILIPTMIESDYSQEDLLVGKLKARRFERTKFMIDGHGYLLWQRKE